MSSVDIKSETDSLRPDSPKCQDNLLNSKFLHFFHHNTQMILV